MPPINDTAQRARQDVASMRKALGVLKARPRPNTCPTCGRCPTCSDKRWPYPPSRPQWF